VGDGPTCTRSGLAVLILRKMGLVKLDAENLRILLDFVCERAKAEQESGAESDLSDLATSRCAHCSGCEHSGRQCRCHQITGDTVRLRQQADS
jgi:multimeric flavodoxin WrbA